MSTSLPQGASKLIPSDPSKVMVIRDITPEIATFSVPFLRHGAFRIGGRATVVKLQTGSLAVFSPVALTPEVKAKVQSMGALKYIVALDFEHHIFIGPWAEEYPGAIVIGPEGLPEKREADPSTKGVKFSHVFTPQNKGTMTISPEFDAEFEYEYFQSHVNKEIVFVHKPSKTMIQADLIFNLPATEQYSKSGESATSGFMTKLFGALMNARGNMIWQRRLIWYGAAASDRKSFALSADRVAQWQFDRMIPCHGDVIETGGKRIFDLATQWFRELKH